MSESRAGVLEEMAAYRAALELTELCYDLEDRFPEDQVPLLFTPLCKAALGVGAGIAEGFGRDGLDAGGELSESTKRAACGKLTEMRHYMNVSVARYCLDESHMKAYEEIERRVRESLGVAADDGGS